MSIKVVLLATLLGIALTGSACSPDGPPDDPPPSATTTLTPTSTPPPPPPTLPAAARADSPAGAEAFARYYMEVLDHAYQTGNTTPLRAAARCRGCDALAQGIEASYKAGNRIEGGRLTIVESEMVKYDADGSSSVRIKYSSDSRKIITPSGAVTEVPAERNVILLLSMQRSGGSWLITNAQPVN